MFKLSGGGIEIEHAHTVATSIGYYANSSQASADVEQAPGDYHGFHVSPADLRFMGGPDYGPLVDGRDPAVNITFRHNDYPASPPTPLVMNYEVHRWDSVQWDLTSSGTVALTDLQSSVVGLSANPLAPTFRLYDGPFRVSFYDTTPDPNALVGHVFLYEQTGLTYRFDGESGPRAVYAENGGVIQAHAGRLKLVEPNVVTPPENEIGNELFSMRSLRLNTTAGAAASGSTSLSLLMRLNVTETMVFDHGASHLRLQYWGEHPGAMEKQLIAKGFVEDAVADAGVYWAYEKTAGRHWSFPVHFIDSQIDVRAS